MRILFSAVLYVWVIAHFVLIAIPFILVNVVRRMFGMDLWYGGIPLCGEYMLRMHGLRVTMTGNFPRQGNYVVISNHESYLDIFLMAKAMKGRRCSACGAHQVFWVPVLGQLLQLFEVVPLYRHDHERAVRGIEQAKRLVHAKQCDMIILPEGTRTTTGELGNFKMGPFHMAMDLGIPIVPICIVGAYEAKPKNRFTFKCVPMHIHIGDPISIADYANPKTLRKGVHTRYGELLKTQKSLHPVG